MYDWLSDALEGSATVVTANRRLARVLQAHFVRQQLAAGNTAWRTPAVQAWQDWLVQMLRASPRQESLPTLINPHQSRLLWERCLLKELPDSSTGIAGLVRLARDAWQRLADWQLSIHDVARSAQNDDQRLFASVAGRYLGILEREYWVDDAGVAKLVLSEVSSGHAATSHRVTFAGFDRERPVVAALRETLDRNGCKVGAVPPTGFETRVELQRFDSVEAEMRAAGAWARQQLVAQPGRSVAIVASDLDQQADAKTRLVREGLVPGWQYASTDMRQAVNVSYGRKLSEFPAVAIALLALEWLTRDLPSTDIGQLLRSPLIGGTEQGGRSRLELELRNSPDRRWSPSLLSAALRGKDAGAPDWFSLVATLTGLRRTMPHTASPAAWAVYIDETLERLGWPGPGTLDSRDFQLVNRWRELLNDLARLDLVSPVMSLASALRRLELMAGDTVFQPEATPDSVQLLGPLEGSGAEFDALWISGLTAARWPPAGNPSPLLSRQLQREHGMPDAAPSDTIAYATGLLRHLGASAPVVVLSYPATEDDAEQTPSALIEALRPTSKPAVPDPGWHAASLTLSRQTVAADDPVPAITSDERVAGGASTIQLQLQEPIAAFITGRLGVRSLQPQATGIPALLRGNIVHDALYSLYSDLPSRSDVAAWDEDALASRVSSALKHAVGRHARSADDVLSELLSLERERMAPLLHRFVEVDARRDEFAAIAAIEHEVEFESGSLRLKLRVDRIDRMTDGKVAIIDYKTGARKKFLYPDGEPREIQLVAYAFAIEEPVAGLALANIDSREVVFDGAGRGYGDAADWDETLTAWMQQVVVACEDLSMGDVRIVAAQGVAEARPLNLLSRYSELRRDA